MMDVCKMALFILVSAAMLPSVVLLAELRTDYLTHEYCHLETFNASCAHAEIIEMMSASYGRMRIGGCVKRSLGYLGCQEDVLELLDSMCSGRTECSMKIVDIAQLRQPCPSDVTSYLEAGYRCRQIVGNTAQTCSVHHKISLPLEGGLLSSTTAAQYGPGSSQCPWRIVANKGQTINITLHNYARMVSESDQAVHGRDPCYEYAVVLDGDSRKNIIGCAGEPRATSVYVSRTNSIELYVTDRIANGQSLYFALEYSVSGCRDITPSAGMSISRTGMDLVIRCNQSTQTWHLTCRGSTWLGDYGNCSGGDNWSLSQMFAGKNTFPYGILIVVSIGVALGVFMGGLLLFAINMYMKRKQPHIPVASEDMLYEEQRSRDKLMSGGGDGGGDYPPGDVMSPARHHGGRADGMRMSSISGPPPLGSRQMAPLPPGVHPSQPQGYDCDDKAGHAGSVGGSMHRKPDMKSFGSPNPYPTYPRANNHVYESPQFA